MEKKELSFAEQFFNDKFKVRLEKLGFSIFGEFVERSILEGTDYYKEVTYKNKKYVLLLGVFQQYSKIAPWPKIDNPNNGNFFIDLWSIDEVAETVDEIFCYDNDKEVLTAILGIIGQESIEDCMQHFSDKYYISKEKVNMMNLVIMDYVSASIHTYTIPAEDPESWILENTEFQIDNIDYMVSENEIEYIRH